MAPHTINMTATYRQLHKCVIIQQCYYKSNRQLFTKYYYKSKG